MSLWWADLLMGVGITLTLLAPVYWLTSRLTQATERRIDEVEDNVTRQVSDLRRSIGDIQNSVSESLIVRAHNELERVDALAGDFRFETLYAVLRDGVAEGLLSKMGIRASLLTVDLWLRFQITGDAITVHLDSIAGPSQFRVLWRGGETFEEISLALADQVRSTSHWPGSSAWELASGVSEIITVVRQAIKLRDRGRSISDVMAIVGDEWILSDWDAQAVDHNYQILFRRLEELDWYRHLSGKSWTDRDNVALMLDEAERLRDLAAQEPLRTAMTN
jgi:hypothetical protein